MYILCTYIYIYVICMYVCLYVCMYVYIYINVYVYIYIENMYTDTSVDNFGSGGKMTSWEEGEHIIHIYIYAYISRMNHSYWSLFGFKINLPILGPLLQVGPERSTFHCGWYPAITSERVTVLASLGFRFSLRSVAKGVQSWHFIRLGPADEKQLFPRLTHLVVL